MFKHSELIYISRKDLSANELCTMWLILENGCGITGWNVLSLWELTEKKSGVETSHKLKLILWKKTIILSKSAHLLSK